MLKALKTEKRRKQMRNDEARGRISYHHLEDLFTKDLTELAYRIKNREVSIVELVNGLLERVHSLNKKINSYITINEEAVDTAKTMDNEIGKGNYKGPLHGIPIGLKDLIDTQDMKTTKGSKIFEHFIADSDAFIVQRLKESGAIIIGKQNTHQFAYGPTGDRSYYGAVKNPYDLTKMSGGSSSGSAAAVAACLCYGALGTDTGGSIRIPASFCGVVGMKPTYGTVSRRGVYPLSSTLDHVGPITRSIKDNSIIMNVIQGYDDKDQGAIYRKPEDFTRFIGKSLNRLTIGVPDQFYFDNLDEQVNTVIDQTIRLLETLGATIVRVDLRNMERISEAQKVILRSEAYAIHENNLKDHPDDWDDEVKERLNTAFKDKGFDYVKAMRVRQWSRKEFNELLANIDALLTPTMAILPPKINERHIGFEKNDENHIRWTITKLTAPTNFIGLPSLSLPCGFSSDGMPIGVQLIGKEWDEARLYQIGYALESELKLNLAKLII